MSVNCTDMLGRSAIQIAVDNENTELVELLLEQDGVEIGDALLYAIREGVYKIVEVSLDDDVDDDDVGDGGGDVGDGGDVGGRGDDGDYDFVLMIIIIIMAISMAHDP